jgi:hypothetical protein
MAKGLPQNHSASTRKLLRATSENDRRGRIRSLCLPSSEACKKIPYQKFISNIFRKRHLSWRPESRVCLFLQTGESGQASGLRWVGYFLQN